MKLIYKKDHPNGFKIYLASILNSTTIDTCVSTDAIRNGAQLEISSKSLTNNLDPNSAVLKIFGKNTSLHDLEWLDWEITFQETLIPYLQSVAAKKEDKQLCQSFKSKLDFLNKAVPSSPNFFFQKEVSATDVVLYGALLPLLSSPKTSKLIEEQSQLWSYANYLRSQPKFKEAEVWYYGKPEEERIQKWIADPSHAVSCSKHSTHFLIKNQSSSANASTAKLTNSTPSPTEDKHQVTANEIAQARLEWENGVSVVEQPKKQTPIIPIKGAKNIMVTSALPYVNNVPHLGNIIGCVLSADCFARFCRIRGDNVVYICGTDEYGTATETKALAEGLTPKEICDKYHEIHSNVYKWFNIDFDFFGRTTTNSQTVAAQAIFWELHKNNKISESTVEQLYCGKCERFLADRFVEGICPFPGCGYEDARGDQCDLCGKLVNAIDLIKPRCKLCSSTPTLRGSTHLFLDLPAIENDLKKYLEEVTPQWTSNAKGICESWIRDGLKERCITRDLKWGTPVPLDGFTDKVFYVWYDAPIGYVSMTMEYCKDKWTLWWKDAEEVSYYQFMAKDNVPFHGIIFPSCQIGTKENWTKVSHLIATEYLNYEDGKFSKSRGVGVFGDQAKETGIPSDVWRFYLLYIRPEAQDTAFSWVDLQTKNNSELLNNLGNFVNRSLKFVFQFYNGVVPEASPKDADFVIMASINAELEKYTNALATCRLRDGIRCILSISRIGNQYIQENEPFKLIKPDRSEEDKIRGATVIHISTNIVALLALLLQPFMPDLSKTIFDILNEPQTLNALPKYFSHFIRAGHKIKQPSPLIRKITDEETEALRKRFAGQVSDELDKSKKVKAKPASSPAVDQAKPPCQPADEAVIQALEKLVLDQGIKVRDMKAAKATKDLLSVEIEQLLQFKEKLAISQGLDPATVRGGGKKNKKK